MKMFTSLFFVTFVASALGKAVVSPKDDALDNNLRLALEKFREAMQTGFPVLGFPPLDPFQVPDFDIPHIEEGCLQLDAVVNDLVISNVSFFFPDVVHADPDLLTLELDLFFPKLRADANYSLNGSIMGVLPIFGNGSMFLEVYGVEVSAFAKLNFTPDGQYVQVMDLNLDAQIGYSYIHLDNLMGQDDFNLAGEPLNNIGKPILDSIPIFEDLSETLMALLNDFLMMCTLDEIQSGQCLM